MASIFEPGKATSTTTQPASPARREAILSVLQALAGSGRQIGGYGGKRGKPGLKLDLASLIKTIQSNPQALDKIVTQSGRPSSPSTFQNLATGATTLGLLAKLGFDFFGEKKVDTQDLYMKVALAKALGLDPKMLGITPESLGIKGGGGDIASGTADLFSLGGGGGAEAGGGDYSLLSDLFSGSSGSDAGGYSVSGGAGLEDYDSMLGDLANLWS